MIKFCSPMDDQGTLYGFGLTASNLTRMELNEDMFFSFDYAGHPHLWGVILFLDQYDKSDEIVPDLGDVALHCERFLNEERGVTPDTLRIFTFGRDAMVSFKEKNYWVFGTKINITHPKDQQVFFSGPDEESIRKLMKGLGLGPSTKPTTKGFG